MRINLITISKQPIQENQILKLVYDSKTSKKVRKQVKNKKEIS